VIDTGGTIGVEVAAGVLPDSAEGTGVDVAPVCWPGAAVAVGLDVEVDLDSDAGVGVSAEDGPSQPTRTM
jgi:hypothetical protein